MGVVYKALDTKLDRYVAIKVLKNEQRLHEFIQRFKIEAKNQAKLSHQNIVPVYGLIEERDMLGIIMEYVEGETLEHFIERKTKIDPLPAIIVSKQVLEAIDYAHLKGFIHRDIKPSNIIINMDGIVKIMDFGISKSIFEKGVTKTGKNIGTLVYMSPEQIKGEELTIESDLYSLGATLYEMLTGHPVFNYDTEYKVIEGHLNEKPAEIADGSSGIPIELQDAIFKSLNKKPEDRYHSGREFIAELEKVEKEMRKVQGIPPLRKKPDFKYRIKAAIYTLLIIFSAATLFYFIFTQVLLQWKSGREFFVIDSEAKQNLIEKATKSELKLMFIPTGTSETLNSIYFADDSLGFACGSNGTLIKSIDNGYTWNTISLPDSVSFFDIEFNYSGTGFLVGEDASYYKSTDKGITWNKALLPSNSSFFMIHFFSNEIGFIAGSKGTILPTSDRGESWALTSTLTDDVIYDIDFIDAQNGFAVTKTGKLLVSTDGGLNWKSLLKISNNYLKSIRFNENKIGFIAGGSGEIYYSKDAGKSWDKYSGNITTGLYDIAFLENNIGLVVGSRGKIITSYNSGNSWTLNDLGNTSSFNSIGLNCKDEIFIAGANGSLIKLSL